MEKFNDKTENRFFYRKQFNDGSGEFTTFNYAALEEITSLKFIDALNDNLGLYYIRKIVIDVDDDIKRFYIHSNDYSVKEERMKLLIIYAYVRKDFHLLSKMDQSVFDTLDLTIS